MRLLRVDRGPIHFVCWMEHHSSPTESHGCAADHPDLTMEEA